MEENKGIGMIDIEQQINEAKLRAELFSQSLADSRQQEFEAMKQLEEEREQWTQSVEEKTIVIEQLERELTSTVETLEVERKKNSSSSSSVAADHVEIGNSHSYNGNSVGNSNNINAQYTLNEVGIAGRNSNYEYSYNSNDNSRNLNNSNFSRNNSYMSNESSNYGESKPTMDASITDLSSDRSEPRYSYYPSPSSRDSRSHEKFFQENSYHNSNAYKDSNYTYSSPYGTNFNNNKIPLNTNGSDDIHVTNSTVSQTSLHANEPKNFNSNKQLYNSSNNSHVPSTASYNSAALEMQKDNKILQQQREINDLRIAFDKQKDTNDQLSYALQAAEGKLKFRIAQVIQYEEQKSISNKTIEEMQKRIKTLQQQLQTQQDEMIIISTELRVANTRNISLENELRDKAETMTIKEHTDASLANKLELAERTIEEFLRRIDESDRRYQAELDDARELTERLRNSLKESEASVANLRTHCSTIESDNARLLETNSHLTQLYRDSVTKSSPSDHSQRNENNYLPPAAKKVSISPRNQYISRSYDSGLTRSKSQDSQKSMKSSSVAGILIPADEEYFYDEENDSPKQRAKDYVEKELNRTKNQLRNSKDNQQALESMVRRYDSGDRSNSNSPRRSTQPISADSSRNTSRSCSSSPSRGNHAVSFSRSSSKSPSRMSNKSCMKQPLEDQGSPVSGRILSASHSFDGRAVERLSKANPTHEPVLYPENSIYNGDGVSLDLEESLDSVGSDVKSQRDVIAKFKVQRNSNKRTTLSKSRKKIPSSGADKQRKADSGKTRRVTGNNMRTPSPSIRNASITQKGSSATEKALITEKQGTRKEKKSIQVIIPSSLSPDGKYKTSEESRTLGLTEGLNNSDFVMDDPLNTSNNEYNARTSNKIISKRVGEPHLRENSTPLPSRKVSSSPSARQPQIAKRSPATKPSPVRRPAVTPSPSAIKVKPPLDSYLYKSGAGSRTRNGMNSSGKKTRSTSLPSHVHRSRSFESLTEVVAQHYKDSLLKKRPKYIK